MLIETLVIKQLLVLSQENITVVKEGNNVIKPSGYEWNIRVLADVLFKVESLGKEEPLIVISYLGKGENPIYNQRRLYTVKTYLKLPEDKIVTAVGEPVDGYGYLEFYIKGKKCFSLAVDKNQEFWVGEGRPESFKGFPYYYLPKPKYTKRRKLIPNK